MARLQNLAGIEAFVRVIELGSFAAAATALGISSPAVSKRIAVLEGQLGVQLLKRTTRKLAATAEGALLLERFRQALRMLEDTEDELPRLRDRPQGLIRVSCTHGLGHQFVVPALAPFLARHPEIEIDLALDDAYANLIDDGVDLAIRNGRMDDASFVARKLGSMALVVCAAPAYLARHGAPAHPDELASHACINFRRKADGRAFSWEFEHEGRRFSKAVIGPIAVDSILAAATLAEHGVGLAQMGDYLARPLIEAGRLVQVMEPFASRDRAHWLCYRDRRHLPHRVQLLVQHLIASFP